MGNQKIIHCLFTVISTWSTLGIADKLTCETRLANEGIIQELRTAEASSDVISKYLDHDSSVGTYFRDVLHAKWVSETNWNNHTVSVLVGNDQDEVTNGKQLFAFVKELAATKTVVFYDADATTAKLIGSAAGLWGMGISAKSASDYKKRIVQIQNPYLRLHLFGGASKSLVAPDSLVGLGIACNGKADYVWNHTERWSTSLNARLTKTGGLWSSEATVVAPENLGKSVSSISGGYWTSRSGIKTFDQDYLLGKIDFYDRRRAIETAIELLSGQMVTRYNTEGEKYPEGAVVYGGGSLIEPYEPLVYDIVYDVAKLGVPIFTGGAGGFMRVANEAAFNVKTLSVGIPMLSLWKEKDAVTGQFLNIKHTTENYPSRIPLLMGRRQLVVIAPGKSGTFREIGATLLSVAANKSVRRHFVFIGNEYYGQLVEDLKALGFEKRVPLHLVSKLEDLPPIIEKLKKDPKFKLKDFTFQSE